MRYNPEIYEYPKDGTKRRVTKFLLFPKKIGSELRWLETASWEEIFFRNDFGPGREWTPLKWLD